MHDAPLPQSPAEPLDGRLRLDSDVSALYDALRVVARRIVRGRTGDRLLEPTELVHECYIRLARSRSLRPMPKSEFMALAATAIRTVLVDHARELKALKRGGGHQRVTLDASLIAEQTPLDMLELDSALTKLSALDARMARVVELRFFGGLAHGEIAAALEVSAATVDKDWTLARAWLHRELRR